jgi:hypothetical protein
MQRQPKNFNSMHIGQDGEKMSIISYEDAILVAESEKDHRNHKDTSRLGSD